ncbi:MAG: host attachment protein [Burkholderiales bacterium]|nr:host attachment protein [Burkholderiales bacterium]
MKNWLIVANAAKARVLEETAEAGTYDTVADLVHPQSRQKGSALAHDRPGHVPGPSAHGTGSSALDAHLTPTEREHDRFARELATLINESVASGRCAGLVLVASNPFLGHVKAHLSDGAQRALLRAVAADYTSLPERELADRVGAASGAY